MVEHDHERNPSQYDPRQPGGLDSRMILLVGAISTALFIAIIFALEAAFVSFEQSRREAHYGIERPPYADYLAEQQQRLTRVSRIEGDEQHAVVPIDLASEQFARQQAEKSNE